MPINPNELSFRESELTINQFISITHTIFKAFDCSPPLDVRSVYLDISEAFDRVWHDGLIYKLIRCGVSGKLLTLNTSFLSDRRQRAVLNGQCLTWVDVSAEVPQGSILGPVFFLAYISDLTVDLRYDVKSLYPYIFVSIHLCIHISLYPYNLCIHTSLYHPQRG